MNSKVNVCTPPVDGHVVNLDTTLGEKLLHVAIGQPIAQIPAHRDGDDLTRNRYPTGADGNADFKPVTRTVSCARSKRPTQQSPILLIGTPFAWGRNLRTGEPVDVRLKGKRRPADVEIFSEEADVVEHYAIMARDNHNFAKFNKIALDQAGDPNPADIQLAWTAGARVIRLTPR